MKEIKVKLDSNELEKIIKKIKDNYSIFPDAMLAHVWALVNDGDSFGNLKPRAEGWSILIDFEPSQKLLDLLSAIDTRDFDSFLAKYNEQKQKIANLIEPRRDEGGKPLTKK